MKNKTAFACIFLSLLASFALADGPTEASHWYTITISEGVSSNQLTGSSTLDPEHLGAVIDGSTLIKLENLRGYGSIGDGSKVGWVDTGKGSKLFLLPRAVLYFKELSGDPLAASK